MATSKPAAKAAVWMLTKLEAEGGELLQEDAAYGLEAAFGSACTYCNDAGNIAIAKGVLAAFRKLTGDRVVWSKSGKYWRLREAADDPSRAQD